MQKAIDALRTEKVSPTPPHPVASRTSACPTPPHPTPPHHQRSINNLRFEKTAFRDLTFRSVGINIYIYIHIHTYTYIIIHIHIIYTHTYILNHLHTYILETTIYIYMRAQKSKFGKHVQIDICRCTGYRGRCFDEGGHLFFSWYLHVFLHCLFGRQDNVD